MLDLFRKLFGDKSASSKEVAKERLRLVLVHDRVNVTPEHMEALRNDLIRVISSYLEINEEEMEISLEKNDSSVALVANIPVNKVKRGEPQARVRC